MATTAEPAINVRRMLPNSVGPSSSSLSKEECDATLPGPRLGVRDPDLL